jgi:hypothetical protein
MTERMNKKKRIKERYSAHKTYRNIIFMITASFIHERNEVEFKAFLLDECCKFIYLACGVVVDKKDDHYAMTTSDSTAASTLAFLCCQFSTHSR